MDSDAFLHPRGPLEPGVYWRRRLVLLAVLLLAGWLAVRVLGGGGGGSRLSADGSPAPTPTPTPEASPSPRPGAGATPTATPTGSRSPSPSPSPSRSPGGPCRTSDLRLSADSDARSYAAGARPVLALSVTNVGPVACTRDLGQAARELRVRSGNVRIWSSDDCAPGGGAQVVTLAPRERRAFDVTWSRRRSAPGCPADQPYAEPGTYQVSGRLGELTVAGDVFTLA